MMTRMELALEDGEYRNKERNSAFGRRNRKLRGSRKE
jgi:hypothetical protein